MPFPIPKLPSQIPMIDMIYTPDNGEYSGISGEWVSDLGTPVSFTGALLPLGEKTLKYSDGTYTNRDRKLYTHFVGVSVNGLINVKDTTESYIVTGDLGYEHLATDFNRYLCKNSEGTER